MLGRYDRAMRARWPVGRLTLLQQAIAAIKRNNGTLFYVPQNFAGSWTDSAGTDPVDAVADVIGRMTDRTGGGAVATQATTANKPTVRRVPKLLGPNLVTNGTFDSGTTGWAAQAGATLASVSGELVVTSASSAFYPGAQQVVSTSAGASYVVTATGRRGTSASNAFVTAIAGNNLLFTTTTAETKSMVVTATSASMAVAAGIFSATGTGTVILDNISVQEVLEWSYAMSFDGSNDSLNTNITTGNEGWVCAGVKLNSAALYQSVFTTGANAGRRGVWLISDGGVWAFATNSGSGNQSGRGEASTFLPTVVEGGWNASSVFVCVNGSTTTSARAGDCTGSSSARIGISDDSLYPLNGNISATVYCPVLPSAADRAIIRKCIGSLQGQSL